GPPPRLRGDGDVPGLPPEPPGGRAFPPLALRGTRLDRLRDLRVGRATGRLGAARGARRARDRERAHGNGSARGLSRRICTPSRRAARGTVPPCTTTDASTTTNTSS